MSAPTGEHLKKQYEMRHRHVYTPPLPWDHNKPPSIPPTNNTIIRSNPVVGIQRAWAVGFHVSMARRISSSSEQQLLASQESRLRQQIKQACFSLIQLVSDAIVEETPLSELRGLLESSPKLALKMITALESVTSEGAKISQKFPVAMLIVLKNHGHRG